MKTFKEITQKVSKELVEKMVSRDENGWPPICTSFIYQPTRPQKVDAPVTNDAALVK